MINEKIKQMLITLDGNSWDLIETDKGLYSMRMGGIRNAESYNPALCEPVLLDIENTTVKSLYTDGETVYIFLDGGDVIKHGIASIDHLGNTYIGFRFGRAEDFDDEFFKDEDVLEINIP